TPVDISVKTRLSAELVNRVKSGHSAAAQYVATYARLRGKYDYLWDELAAVAWLDPSLITAKDTRYMDVNLDRGGNYGDTLSWAEANKPKVEVQPVEVQFDLNAQRFYELFVALLTGPTPHARGAK
ncbi:MAG TPA: nucleoside hydrolase, partial [Terriglobales bacterium]